MRTIGVEYERGSLDYLVLVHHVLLDVYEEGLARNLPEMDYVAEYRHGRRQVRVVGRRPLARLLFQLNRVIATEMVKRTQGRDCVLPMDGESRAAGRFAPKVAQKIMQGTL